MTELEFYKFLEFNKIEYSWSRKDNKQDVVCFIPLFLCEAFYKLIDGNHYHGIVECVLKEGCIALFMADIFEYHGIHLEAIFENTKTA